ncbi:MAG: imidazoleglycerol-phosphate dehydratase HisB [Suipraeoptans sp.]
MDNFICKTRKTNETDISLKINLNGSGSAKIDTGIGFFDHMLSGFAKHGLIDLEILVKGDLEVDPHHTVEDTGIVLGEAILEALGDKAGINRYGHFTLPMDDALVLCAIDLSNRPYFNFEAEFTMERLGTLDTELIREFFYAVSSSPKMNLHILLLSGENNHHIGEAMFKAFGRSLLMATKTEPRMIDAWTTKGSL